MTALDERLSYIVLNMISGVGPARCDQLIERFGSATAALTASSAEVSRVPGIGKSVAEKIANWRDTCELDAELAMAERSGVKIITRCDPDYPDALHNIPNGPLCIYVRGTLPTALDERGLAVIGTRRMSRYGRDMTKHLSEAAIIANLVIVSGLALGVDTVAHEAAVTLNGCTVGVMGCGLGRIYPQENTALARQIVETGGAVISEFPMMMPPNSRTFPMRNRVVAALCRGILVVEAGIGSGALITVHHGLEYGKTIFAVPGQVDNPQARGCHRLIKQGACLVETFDDIAEEFAFLPGFTPDRVREEEAPYGDDAVEQGRELKIITALARKSFTLEALAVETEIPVGELMGLMMRLELKRRIRPVRGGYELTK